MTITLSQLRRRHSDLLTLSPSDYGFLNSLKFLELNKDKTQITAFGNKVERMAWVNLITELQTQKQKVRILCVLIISDLRVLAVTSRP